MGNVAEAAYSGSRDICTNLDSNPLQARHHGAKTLTITSCRSCAAYCINAVCSSGVAMAYTPSSSRDGNDSSGGAVAVVVVVDSVGSETTI